MAVTYTVRFSKGTIEAQQGKHLWQLIAEAVVNSWIHYTDGETNVVKAIDDAIRISSIYCEEVTVLAWSNNPNNKGAFVVASFNHGNRIKAS